MILLGAGPRTVTSNPPPLVCPSGPGRRVAYHCSAREAPLRR
jgi:hypothetical protein